MTEKVKAKAKGKGKGRGSKGVCVVDDDDDEQKSVRCSCRGLLYVAEMCKVCGFRCVSHCGLCGVYVAHASHVHAGHPARVAKWRMSM